jgi:hypothetical protein
LFIVRAATLCETISPAKSPNLVTVAIGQLDRGEYPSLSLNNAVGIQRKDAKDAEKRGELLVGIRTPNDVLSVVDFILRNSAFSAFLRFLRPGLSASFRLRDSTMIQPFANGRRGDNSTSSLMSQTRQALTWKKRTQYKSRPL